MQTRPSGQLKRPRNHPASGDVHLSKEHALQGSCRPKVAVGPLADLSPDCPVSFLSTRCRFSNERRDAPGDKARPAVAWHLGKRLRDFSRRWAFWLETEAGPCARLSSSREFGSVQLARARDARRTLGVLLQVQKSAPSLSFSIG